MVEVFTGIWTISAGDFDDGLDKDLRCPRPLERELRRRKRNKNEQHSEIFLSVGDTVLKGHMNVRNAKVLTRKNPVWSGGFPK